MCTGYWAQYPERCERGCGPVLSSSHPVLSFRQPWNCKLKKIEIQVFQIWVLSESEDSFRCFPIFSTPHFHKSSFLFCSRMVNVFWFFTWSVLRSHFYVCWHSFHITCNIVYFQQFSFLFDCTCILLQQCQEWCCLKGSLKNTCVPCFAFQYLNKRMPDS